MGAETHARHTREEARKAAKEADRAEAHAWSLRMEGYGGPAQPSPTIAQCLNGGLRWLEVECNRCKTRASLPLDAIRRPRDTPIWKLEAALKCRSCRKGRYAPPVHMIKLTERQEITPYKWVHPDDDDRQSHGQEMVRSKVSTSGSAPAIDQASSLRPSQCGPEWQSSRYAFRAPPGRCRFGQRLPLALTPPETGRPPSELSVQPPLPP
jgi:hypothetical protein